MGHDVLFFLIQFYTYIYIQLQKLYYYHIALPRWGLIFEIRFLRGWSALRSENIRAYISRSFTNPMWHDILGNKHMQKAIVMAQICLYVVPWPEVLGHRKGLVTFVVPSRSWLHVTTLNMSQAHFFCITIWHGIGRFVIFIAKSCRVTIILMFGQGCLDPLPVRQNIGPSWVGDRFLGKAMVSNWRHPWTFQALQISRHFAVPQVGAMWHSHMFAKAFSAGLWRLRDPWVASSWASLARSSAA